MFNRNVCISAAFVVLMTVAADAVALPYSAYDPRSFAMGGTGVASGTSANASFYNPALLAAADAEDDFSLELPIVAARLSDPDDLMKAASDFNDADYVTGFTNAIDAYNTSQTQANSQAVINAADGLISGLESLSNKALQGELDTAIVIGIPSKRYGAAVYINSWVIGGGRGLLSNQDLTTINAIKAFLANGALPSSLPDPTLTSSVDARLAWITELGVSLAREISLGGQSVALGVTPKYVRVQTYDYTFTGSGLDNADISLDQGKKTDSNLNLDFGLAKDFGNGWRTGFAVKNLISQTYTTVLGNTLKVEPQARVGVARHNDWSTVAMDFDLTENKPVEFDSKTQYLGLGAELDAWGWAQVRLGYRFNLADNDTSVASLGVGVSPFGIHLDVSVAGNSNELGAAIQTGFRF